MAEFNLTPVFRMEMFIDAIINGTTPPEPQFREEFYFAKVAGMDVELPTPITRREFYLAKYAGMNVDLPVPVTRDEMYLALACGLGVEPPEPVFRDEYWLYELSGGGKWSWKTVSGSMIHITDALASPMQKCEVTLEPIQDLHGQDSPYPAGGWVNKLNLVDKYVYQAGGGKLWGDGYSGAVNTLTETGFTSTSRDNSYGPKVYAGYYNSGDVLTFVCNISQGNLNIAYTTVEPAINVPYTNVTGTSGTKDGRKYITVTAPSDGYYYVGAYANNNTDIVVTNAELVIGNTVPSSYSPYSNICPITGWTGCNVTRTGKNLFDLSSTVPFVNSNWTDYENGYNNTTVTKTETGFVTNAGSANMGKGLVFNVPKDGQYTLSFNRYRPGGEAEFDVTILEYPMQEITFPISSRGRTQKYKHSTDTSMTFTALKDYTYTIEAYLSSAEIIGLTDIQLEEGSSGTTYEPFGTTYPISWQTEAGTVYGGTLTINRDGSMDLQPTHAGVVYTSSNINWLTAANGYLGIVIGESGTLENWQAPTHCSHYKINGSPIGIIGSNDSKSFWIRAQDLENPSQKANVTNENIQDYRDYYLAQAENGTPLTVVWELKRNIPDPIHLQSIEQISTLAGENNVWSNGDSVKITYKAQAS